MTVIFNTVKTSSQMNISGCQTQAYVEDVQMIRHQKIKICIKTNVPYLHVQFAKSWRKTLRVFIPTPLTHMHLLMSLHRHKQPEKQQWCEKAPGPLNKILIASERPSSWIHINQIMLQILSWKLYIQLYTMFCINLSILELTRFSYFRRWNWMTKWAALTSL